MRGEMGMGGAAPDSLNLLACTCAELVMRHPLRSWLDKVGTVNGHHEARGTPDRVVEQRSRAMNNGAPRGTPAWQQQHLASRGGSLPAHRAPCKGVDAGHRPLKVARGGITDLELAGDLRLAAGQPGMGRCLLGRIVRLILRSRGLTQAWP